MERFIPYRYRHAPIPGGGFVTGILFHPTCEGLAYARTDIGGLYRLAADGESWESLSDGATHPERWATYPLSIAVSKEDENLLFTVAGDGRANRKLGISCDKGESFRYCNLPTPVHGNASGRGTGERLIVSPTEPKTLYFASQTGGLWVTRDLGQNWRHIPVAPIGGRPENDLTLIWAHPRNPRLLVVGASGEANAGAGNVRGASLYLTRDGGETFHVMPGQPAPILNPDCTHPGYVAQRCAFDGQALYVTFAAPGNCWAGFRSYACDTGSCFDGALMRYTLTRDGDIAQAQELTPRETPDAAYPQRRMRGGLGGLGVDAQRPGVVVIGTVCHPAGETLFFSRDAGQHFTPVLHGLTVGQLDLTVPYMKPEYNGGGSIVHWVSDIAIDPFRPDRAFFTTGTGIFGTRNFTQALDGRPVRWQPCCVGLEETVHLNVYSPAAGPVRLLDIVGDLGGFAFTRLDAPCENSFADAAGNRYITCMNADYPEATASPMVVTARGNWTGKTVGGLIVSDDHARTWSRLPDPDGLSPLMDSLLRGIRRPNVNAGWAAISADGETILWGLAQGDELPAHALTRTDDRGRHWSACAVLDESSAAVADSCRVKVFSDRVWPEVFYGFGGKGELYASGDRGRTFVRIAPPQGFPVCDLAGIDSRQQFEIRVQAGAAGVIWLALGDAGLWRLAYQRGADAMAGERLTPQGDTVYRVGLGKAAPGAEAPALYINGILRGAYGFYRSLDGGRHFDRINGERQMYGDIRSIAGDPREFGRYYIATGTRGVLYGEPLEDV